MVDTFTAKVSHEVNVSENPFSNGDSSGSSRITRAQAATTLTMISRQLPSKKRKKEVAYEISSKSPGVAGGSTTK